MLGAVGRSAFRSPPQPYRELGTQLLPGDRAVEDTRAQDGQDEIVEGELEAERFRVAARQERYEVTGRAGERAGAPRTRVEKRRRLVALLPFGEARGLRQRVVDSGDVIPRREPPPAR